MKIEIRLEEGCSEPKIIVITDTISPELNALIQRLTDEKPDIIAGFRDDTVEALEQDDIFRIYASSGKVYADTANGKYTLRVRLYELEQRLDARKFARISNSEIINLKKVKNFDLGFTGTICVTLRNGTTTYVSRRFVSRIKQLLGI